MKEVEKLIPECQIGDPEELCIGLHDDELQTFLLRNISYKYAFNVSSTKNVVLR